MAVTIVGTDVKVAFTEVVFPGLVVKEIPQNVLDAIDREANRATLEFARKVSAILELYKLTGQAGTPNAIVKF